MDYLPVYSYLCFVTPSRCESCDSLLKRQEVCVQIFLQNSLRKIKCAGFKVPFEECMKKF